MADSIARILERQVSELEILERRKIFSGEEIQAIVRQRTNHEYKLKRFASMKIDYLRYIEYELNLHELIRLRKLRLGIKRIAEADHSWIRRVQYIFDRSIKKFPGDISLWLQYIHFNDRVGSVQKLASTIPRCLALHPREPIIWIKAAQLELQKNADYGAARIFLQRGLRFCPRDQSLWLFLFHLEIRFLAVLMERKMALGMHAEAESERAKTLRKELNNGGEDAEGRDFVIEMESLSASDRALADCLLPRAVYRNAIKAIPDIQFRLAIIPLIPHPFNSFFPLRRPDPLLKSFLIHNYPLYRAMFPFSMNELDRQESSKTFPFQVSFNALFQEIYESIDRDFAAERKNWLLKAQRAMEILAEKQFIAKSKGNNGNQKDEAQAQESAAAKGKRGKKKARVEESESSDSEPLESAAYEIFEAGIDFQDEGKLSIFEEAVKFFSQRVVNADQHSPEAVKFSVSALEKLFDRLDQLLSEDSLIPSVELFSQWTRFALTASDVIRASQILTKAFRYHPSSSDLWKLKFHLECKKYAFSAPGCLKLDDLMDVFQQGIRAAVEEQELMEISKEWIDFVCGVERENLVIIGKFRDLIRSSYEQGYHTLRELLSAAFLSWAGIRLMNRPRELESQLDFLRQYRPLSLALQNSLLEFEMELALFTGSAERIRRSFDSMCEEFGQSNASVWARFIVWEQGRGEIGRVHSLYDRAKRKLSMEMMPEIEALLIAK